MATKRFNPSSTFNIENPSGLTNYSSSDKLNINTHEGFTVLNNLVENDLTKKKQYKSIVQATTLHLVNLLGSDLLINTFTSDSLKTFVDSLKPQQIKKTKIKTLKQKLNIKNSVSNKKTTKKVSLRRNSQYGFDNSSTNTNSEGLEFGFDDNKVSNTMTHTATPDRKTSYNSGFSSNTNNQEETFGFDENKVSSATPKKKTGPKITKRTPSQSKAQANKLNNKVATAGDGALLGTNQTPAQTTTTRPLILPKPVPVPRKRKSITNKLKKTVSKPNNTPTPTQTTNTRPLITPKPVPTQTQTQIQMQQNLMTSLRAKQHTNKGVRVKEINNILALRKAAKNPLIHALSQLQKNINRSSIAQNINRKIISKKQLSLKDAAKNPMMSSLSSRAAAMRPPSNYSEEEELESNLPNNS